MDLALELGMDVDVMKRSMSERAVRQWHLYARRKLLPHRRLELYLAQIALVIKTTAQGGKGRRYKLDDFLFEPQEIDDDDDDIDDLEAAKDAFDFKPRVRSDA